MEIFFLEKFFYVPAGTIALLSDKLQQKKPGFVHRAQNLVKRKRGGVTNRFFLHWREDGGRPE